MSLGQESIAYARRVLPCDYATCAALPVRGPVHLILALADHFEPAIDPASGYKRVPRPEQERRQEWWFREYPKVIDGLRDHDGRLCLTLTFIPPSNTTKTWLKCLPTIATRAGERPKFICITECTHPDTAENTRRQLTEFRDQLAFRHRCLSVEEGSRQPRYAFVHGNFALANSAGGRCSAASIQRCRFSPKPAAMPTSRCRAALWHPAQTAKSIRVYECALPLDQVAPHRKGTRPGRRPRAAGSGH